VKTASSNRAPGGGAGADASVALDAPFAPVSAAAPIALVVNGLRHALAVPRDAPLLNVLRNDLGLNGPKYGCGLGECGACAVLVDGSAALACVIPVGGVEGRSITTLEGLAGLLGDGRGKDSDSGAGDGNVNVNGNVNGNGNGAGAGTGTGAALHPVQQAFIDCQAAQCGYCLNGMIIGTVALLQRCPRPSDDQVRRALAHHLCRCGTHLEILQAVHCAAARMAARA
jgi:nicotinate dehydrogenase subunit A